MQSRPMRRRQGSSDGAAIALACGDIEVGGEKSHDGPGRRKVSRRGMPRDGRISRGRSAGSERKILSLLARLKREGMVRT